MSDWLLNLPVVWMTVVILGATYLGTAGIYMLITRLAVGERARAFKGISPGMLPPLGIIFALFVGFIAAQVWNDADRANTAVNREASALRAAVLVAGGLGSGPEGRIRDFVRQHVQDAVTREWPAMARGTATLTIAPTSLINALRLTLALEPSNASQASAQRETIAALENALEARRQRIIVSRSSINRVKWTALIVQAVLTLIAIAMVHADNRATNRIILTMFATTVGISFVMLTAHAYPFAGEISVRPGVLLQVMPESGSPPAPEPGVDRRGTRTTT